MAIDVSVLILRWYSQYSPAPFDPNDVPIGDSRSCELVHLSSLGERQ